MTAANGKAPQLGDLIEEWVDVTFVGWTYADESDHDFVDESGRKIEVKGTQPWVKNGYDHTGKQAHTRGRFKFWEREHASLESAGGEYLLIIYEEVAGDIDILAYKTLSASRVGTKIDTWLDVDNTRCTTKGDVNRSAWTNFYDEDELPEEARER